jgi:hypothetical protein
MLTCWLRLPPHLRTKAAQAEERAALTAPTGGAAAQAQQWTLHPPQQEQG